MKVANFRRNYKKNPVALLYEFLEILHLELPKDLLAELSPKKLLQELLKRNCRKNSRMNCWRDPFKKVKFPKNKNQRILIENCEESSKQVIPERILRNFRWNWHIRERNCCSNFQMSSWRKFWMNTLRNDAKNSKKNSGRTSYRNWRTISTRTVGEFIKKCSRKSFLRNSWEMLLEELLEEIVKNIDGYLHEVAGRILN